MEVQEDFYISKEKNVVNMAKLKLKSKIYKNVYGYYIGKPIYAYNHEDSFMQQASPYYLRIGNLINWINKNIEEDYIKEYLIEDCRNIKKGRSK